MSSYKEVIAFIYKGEKFVKLYVKEKVNKSSVFCSNFR